MTKSLHKTLEDTVVRKRIIFPEKNFPKKLRFNNTKWAIFIFGLFFVENQYDDYNGKKINHLIIGQNM